MLSRIFPRQFDNAYRGHWLALWLLVPVMLMRAVEGVNSIVMTRQVATGADGIPLASYDPAAAATVVALFALLGLYGLILPLLGTMALIRYRTMVPLLYLLLLLVQLGSRAILMLDPITRAGVATAGGIPIGPAITYGLLATTALGLVLSLRVRESVHA
jgi:hypothetical protein